jgi:hypothetical protein
VPVLNARRSSWKGRRAAAAAASGPKQQARAVQRRCQARLAELGFAGLEEYLRTTTSASLAALVK